MTALAITEMTNWAVDLIDVRKTYRGRVQALKGVNIQVGRGEIFGLLGPNGAGKTTLVKIMMTVVKPTRAFGTILGRPLGHRGKLARVGYLPESHRFPGYLTGAQLLDYYAALAKVPLAKRKANAPRLLDRVSMTAWANTRIDRYSKGMIQRLGIAQALMNDPELVVLDEPTDGLDPVGRRDVLEMVCDRVSILVDGLVARQGTLSELTERTLEYRVHFKGQVGAEGEKLRALGGHLDGDVVTFPGRDVGKVNAAIDVLRGAGVLIESVQPRKLSLEEIFVEAMTAKPNPRGAR
ncbi:MAG: ABC transporter ATP-binding protein [Planctomycetes bacterium]|nr:ABC transporter ATP-binding protein [Planctomycetota bacterium]